MRNYDRSPSLCRPVKCFLDLLLATNINGAGGLIENEYCGLLNDTTRDGNPLTLSST